LVDIIETLELMVEDIILAIPTILAAVIVIAIGWLVGTIVGKAVNILVEKIGMERAFDQSSTGKSFRAAGLDLSNVIGMFVKAFIIVLAIVWAIEILSIGGTLGSYLTVVADYLPRLLGGLLILILGVVLVDFLANFIGKMIRPMFPPEKVEIADMIKNLLFIGLIAFIILLALDTMLLSGGTIYPLILGFVIIGVGIILTDTLVRSIVEDHAEFRSVAGYAKFVLYSIFLIIGAGAIFATFPNVTSIVANVSWAFAIALAVLLVPVAYGLTKKMAKEMN